MGTSQSSGAKRSGPSYTIANVMGFETEEATQANAQAISAVPEMLEVLEGLVFHWNELDMKARRELMMDARAAIAKARGEARAEG